MNRTMAVRFAAVAALASMAVSVWSQKQFDPSNGSAQPVAPAIPIIKYESPEGSVPQDWTLRPRPAIKFTPFEMLDPTTGKPVNADDIIEVNGVKMRAGDFYRQLNAMEQWLNEQGYSLRTDTYFEYFSPTLEAEIAQSEAYAQWLNENAPLDGSVYGQESDFSMASCYNYSNSWTSNWFGNSLFGVQLRGSVSAQACLSMPINASVTGSGTVRGRLASYEADVATANGTATVSADQNATNWSYQVSVDVLGRRVWGDSRSGQLPSIFQGFQRSWNFTVAQVNWNSPTIPLFCVNVLGINICANGRVGVSGALNLAANVNINLFQQQAQANPYGSIGGYAEAWLGANIVIARAEVGVRGNITFLNGGVTGRANGQLGFENGALFYQIAAGLDANLCALSGNIQGYARGCIWFFGWRCAEASATLFSWNGWCYNGTLVNWNRRLP